MRPQTSEIRHGQHMDQVLIQQASRSPSNQARQDQAGGWALAKEKARFDSAMPPSGFRTCSSNRQLQDAETICAGLPEKRVRLYRPRPLSGSRRERKDPRTAACSAPVSRKAADPLVSC